MCTMFHWHAAVRDQNKQYLKLLLLLKVVDTKRLTITMFDSLHIQQESAAQRIREFAIYFFPNTKWEIHFDREIILCWELF